MEEKQKHNRLYMHKQQELIQRTRRGIAHDREEKIKQL